MTPDADARLNEALTHAQFVRAVARGVLGGDADVEDVLQETFLVAWTQGPRKPGAFRAWIGTVAKRLALDRLRSGGRRRRRESAAAKPEALPSVATIAAREETRRLLLEAVLALDEPYRATLLWRYHASLSLAEIAARQGVPEETVHTRLQRGLARLRDRLDREHPGGRAAWIAALVPLGRGTDGGQGTEGSAAHVERAQAPRGAGVPALATVGALVGGLVVKKVVVAAGVVALLAAGGVVFVRALGPPSSDGAVAEAPPTVAEVVPVAGGANLPSLAAAGPAGAQPKAAASVAPTTSASLGRLHVRVLGPDGQTMEGATVTIAPGVERLPSTRYEQVLGTRVGQTDASGLTLEVPVGRYAVRVRAPNLRPLDLEAAEVAADRTVEREARLDEGIVVSLRLLDPDTREPVARARVHVGGPLNCVAEGTTDADGRCALRGFAPPTAELLRTGGFWSSRIFFRAFAEGYVPVDWSTECPKAIGPVSYELTLRRGTTVRVRATATDGGAPPGVRVSIVLDQNYENPIVSTEPVVFPRRDGWAVLPPLAPGQRTIRVSAGDQKLTYEGVTQTLEVGTTPMDVEVVLRRFAPVRLEGRVLLPDGRPAPAVAVQFVPGGVETGAWLEPEVVSDGRFVKEQASVGPGALYVYVPGYLRQSFPIDVSATPSEPLTLTLKDGPRLAGRVVDRTGKPVGGVLVGTWKGITFANGSKSSTSLGETTTGDDGRFSFVAADLTPVSLGVQSTDWLLTRLLTTDDAVIPGEDVTLVVKPASEGQGLPLVLRVVEPNGKAAQGHVSVQWTTDKGLRGGGTPTVLPDGRLRFGFWDAPGTYDIDVYVPGYRMARLRAVRIEDTTTPETHDVRLDLGGVLRLQVLTAAGQPWIRHAFQVGEHQLRLLSTDDSGVIELTGNDPGVVAQVRVIDTEDATGRTYSLLRNVQAPGSYEVVVQRSGHVTAKLPWTYDEIPEGAVSELLDAAGRVVDRMELVRYPGSGDRRKAGTWHRIVADGSYTVRVTSGTARLTGTATGRVGADVEATIGP